MSLSNPTNPPIVNEHVATRVSTGLVFAVDENQTKVNQIHGINPAGSTGAGIPKPVTNVTASIANASVGATSTVSVRFQRNPQDNNFAGVRIYAKGYQGNKTSVQVGGGQDSPCTVILNNTGESVTLVVQSVGNGGVSPLASSPTYGIKLPKSKTGGAGTSTITSPSTLDQLPNGAARVAWDSPTQKAAAVDSAGNLKLKNISTTNGVTPSPSLTSTTYTVVPEMTITLTTKGNKVLIMFDGNMATQVGGIGKYALFLDGVQLSTDYELQTKDINLYVPVNLSYLDVPTAGSHTYDIRWAMGSAGLTINSLHTGRSFQVIELG